MKITVAQTSRPVVAVAMSGGVDSSVAVALLLEQGYPVIGVTMCLPHFGDTAELQAVDDARAIATQLGIPHHTFDLRLAFEQHILRYFCAEYTAGRTPNPCVFCNPLLKFGLLFDLAQSCGAELFATGHYAQAMYDADHTRYLLKAAVDQDKDQSYFLYRLTQAQLARTLFPLAAMTKTMTRAKARTLGIHLLPARQESHGNCFLATRHYREYLEQVLPKEQRKPGLIRDVSGTVRGEHQGIQFYTIGQRRGVEIEPGKRHYVVAIRPEKNEIIIGEEADLWSESCLVRQAHFSAMSHLRAPLEVAVKVRHRNRATPAILTPGHQPDEVFVTFREPKRAITPGQSAVFYQGDVVVGGGIIQLPY